MRRSNGCIIDRRSRFYCCCSHHIICTCAHVFTFARTPQCDAFLARVGRGPFFATALSSTKARFRPVRARLVPLLGWCLFPRPNSLRSISGPGCRALASATRLSAARPAKDLMMEMMMSRPSVVGCHQSNGAQKEGAALLGMHMCRAIEASPAWGQPQRAPVCFRSSGAAAVVDRASTTARRAFALLTDLRSIFGSKKHDAADGARTTW